jgi:hypothetical protein
MYRNKSTILALSLVLIVSLPVLILGQAAGVRKNMEVGALRMAVLDSGDEGEGSFGWGQGLVPYRGWDESAWSTKAWFLGVESFTDTSGVTHTPMVTGCAQWGIDYDHLVFPISDAQGYTIHRYYKHQPPDVSTDGVQNNQMYPLDAADHLDPDNQKIPGNADGLIESWMNTNIGITIHQRAIAYSQTNHDDYVLYEWTFKNTGNVDYDSEIELPDQTLNNVYFLRQHRVSEWPTFSWITSFGELYSDTWGDNLIDGAKNFFLSYGYMSHAVDGSFDGDWDNLAATSVEDDYGYPVWPLYAGELLVFASAAVNDMVNHNPDQPWVSFTESVDLEFVVNPPSPGSSAYTQQQVRGCYRIMEEGNSWFAGAETPGIISKEDMTGPDVKPGHHMRRFDEMVNWIYPPGSAQIGWYMASPIYVVGPYTLAPGDSFRVVWASVAGMISSRTGWEIGNAWSRNSLTEADLPPNVSIVDGLPDNFPVIHERDTEGELIHPPGDTMSVTNNIVRDAWIYTGKDSLFRNAYAAVWAYENDYFVPEPPPPPSVTITSRADHILVEWENNSGDTEQIAGYRVYRLLGSDYPDVQEGTPIMYGLEELVFECGAGTDHPEIVYSFMDTVHITRGFDYFYIVTAFDDGDNLPGIDSEAQVLESSIFVGRSNLSASLLRAPGTRLKDIRIVPNPYNIGSWEDGLQYPGEVGRYRIMFFNLPPKCKIRIFSESLDLIREIDHVDRSGDQPWGPQADIPELHLASDQEQRIVSGLYFVQFEVTEDYSDPATGDILYRKGESIVKKLVVIR